MEPSKENTVYEFYASGWAVKACVQRLFVPSGKVNVKGKEVRLPVTHSWISMEHDRYEPIRFGRGRSGMFNDSRQKKDCALLDACKGHKVNELVEIITKLTGDRERSELTVWKLV